MTTTTRRAIFGTLAVPLLAAPITAVSASPSLASIWTEAYALATGPARLTDADCERLWAMERAVLEGAIRSRADALAKLKAVALSFERGELADGADARALADATAWLEAH